MAKEVKPRNDAYTGVLFISLLAMIGACVLLFMDYQEYSAKTPPKTLPSIELPKISSGTPLKGSTPVEEKKAEEKKVEEKKAEEKKAEEKKNLKEMSRAIPIVGDQATTSIKPMIETPPTPPTTIAPLVVPNIPPIPVTSLEDGKTNAVQPTKFEENRPLVSPVTFDEPKLGKPTETNKPTDKKTPPVLDLTSPKTQSEIPQLRMLEPKLQPQTESPKLPNLQSVDPKSDTPKLPNLEPAKSKSEKAKPPLLDPIFVEDPKPMTKPTSKTEEPPSLPPLQPIK